MTGSDVVAGRKATRQHRVEEPHSAAEVGSGDVTVLATPMLLAWMEAATCDALASHLGDHQTSVGWKIHITHERPTHVGSLVDVEAEVTSIDDNKVQFAVEARDESGARVGKAEITRVIVDRDRFAPTT